MGAHGTPTPSPACAKDKWDPNSTENFKGQALGWGEGCHAAPSLLPKGPSVQLALPCSHALVGGRAGAAARLSRGGEKGPSVRQRDPSLPCRAPGAAGLPGPPLAGARVRVMSLSWKEAR